MEICHSEFQRGSKMNFKHTIFKKKSSKKEQKNRISYVPGLPLTVLQFYNTTHMTHTYIGDGNLLCIGSGPEIDFRGGSELQNSRRC